MYTLFVTGTGSQQFTASDTGDTSSTQSATLTAGQVSTLNFTLAAAASSSQPPAKSSPASSG
jgi:hypothetical protein